MMLKTWMSLLNKSVMMMNIFLPGSHDSGAYKMLFCYKNWARTQELSIYDQLCIGTRYLDIRLTNIGGVYYVMHRFKYMPFTEVAEDINKFVNETDEIVLMGVKEDVTNRVEYDDFFRLFVNTLDGSLRKYTTTFRADMTLGDIYSGSNRVFVLENGSTLYNIWPNTLSENVLFDKVEKALCGAVVKYEKEYLVNFDYVYTITGIYIAKCYFILLIVVMFCSTVLYESGFTYYRSSIYGAILISIPLICVVPLLSMKTLANEIKYFIRKNIHGKAVIPHIMSYDYVDEKTNAWIIHKNF